MRQYDDLTLRVRATPEARALRHDMPPLVRAALLGRIAIACGCTVRAVQSILARESHV